MVTMECVIRLNIEEIVFVKQLFDRNRKNYLLPDMFQTNFYFSFSRKSSQSSNFWSQFKEKSFHIKYNEKTKPEAMSDMTTPPTSLLLHYFCSTNWWSRFRCHTRHSATEVKKLFCLSSSSNRCVSFFCQTLSQNTRPSHRHNLARRNVLPLLNYRQTAYPVQGQCRHRCRLRH